MINYVVDKAFSPKVCDEPSCRPRFGGYPGFQYPSAMLALNPISVLWYFILVGLLRAEPLILNARVFAGVSVESDMTLDHLRLLARA